MTRGKRTYTTVVADSHNLFRRGLATLISAEADMEVLGEVTTAEQALALLATDSQDDERPSAHADILLIEVGLVRDNPVAIRGMRLLPQTTSVLLLAPEESAECLEITVACGARGYMLKSAGPAMLIAGIRQSTTSQENGRGLSSQAPDLKALAESEEVYARMTPLTAREQEVMTLLAEGRTVREVASELALSMKTIEAHKLNLMRKLDIHNRASLVEYAVRSGFITAQPV